MIKLDNNFSLFRTQSYHVAWRNFECSSDGNCLNTFSRQYKPVEKVNNSAEHHLSCFTRELIFTRKWVNDKTIFGGKSLWPLCYWWLVHNFFWTITLLKSTALFSRLTSLLPSVVTGWDWGDIICPGEIETWYSEDGTFSRNPESTI